jgi:hypothetical protein
VPQHIYFDVHVYDWLLDHAQTSEAQTLLNTVRSGETHVYGSVAVIEELTGKAASDTQRYLSLIETFWTYVKSDLLLDRASLLRSEIEKSNRLSLKEICFSRQFIREKVQPASRHPNFATDLSPKVLRRKLGVAGDMNKSYVEIEEKIALICTGPPDDAVRHQWLAEIPQEELQPHLDDLRHSMGYKPVSVRAAPCAAALIAYCVARAKRALASAKKFESSATYDYDHYVYSAAVGRLVTEDDDLLKMLKMIDTPPLTVMGCREFFATLHG